jgi:hypothetical protein
LNETNETKEVETITSKVTIEIHRIGASVAPYLPKEILKAIPTTAQKLKRLEQKKLGRKPWLVEFSIRKENGKTVMVLEPCDQEVKE